MKNNCLIIILNIINFILYGVDKFKAKNNLWRIREKVLLIFSIFAGVGGFLGMEIFHHKTHKTKFYLANIIGILLTVYLIN
ncbi:DUF1294 domain-containing protein [Peptoniphilus sp. SGI.035]|uniref:DUF1294 domain-containing protein n=1 Tax=Peptoniphilus sp. SGI.035 TaxID=3420564 RepID=UPI003CFFD4D2